MAKREVDESQSGATAEPNAMMVDGAPAGPQQQVAAELPWGTLKLLTPSVLDPSIHPGHYAAQSLIVDFIAIADRKIAAAIAEPLDKLLTKTLQRGEDTQFDNVLRALNGVSEHCLPSVLRAICLWYDQQLHQCISMLHKPRDRLLPTDSKSTHKSEPRTEREFVVDRRVLAVDFIFCLVLIEILPQLSLHPGHEEQIAFIIQQSFKQFRYKEPSQVGPNISNAHIISDLYAEVIGVIAQSRFSAVRRRFTAELNELRHEKEANAVTVQNIINLLMGMKFVRVKTNNLDELEQGISFLHELGVYFLEVKDRDANKDVKHHISGLLVEILLPLAAQVKTETNVPTLINFVEMLYSYTLDLASKKRHQLNAFPLLTCLLCISQSKFFLSNWHQFLTLTLSNLKSRDNKLARVALESLYRLLWVYVIRIGCESQSNTATHSRLQSICSSLFPKGGRAIIPRDAPLHIFVKIIHFIANGKLDFAFKEIIFDLLCVNRPVRTIYPERMNVGLRSLMVIADSLQQKEGPPGMPRNMGPVASGTIQRIKKTYLTRPLTVDTAKNLGLDLYYAPCRRAFDGILKALDREVIRPLMANVVQYSGKELEEMLSGDRKPKLDLLRICIASIPRLLPDGMSRAELIDLIARTSMHCEQELKGLAAQTLQHFITECPDWRTDVLHGFLQFISRDIQDAYPQLLESALRLLLQLLAAWRGAHVSAKEEQQQDSSLAPIAEDRESQQPSRAANAPKHTANNEQATVLHCCEGMALVMLCQEARTPARKLAITLLKEVRQLLPMLCHEEHERPVLNVLDSAVPYVIHKYVQGVTHAEKINWLCMPHLDFIWLYDKVASLEVDPHLINAERANEYLYWDCCAVVLSGFLEPQYLLNQCPTACAYAWPVVYTRLNACFQYVDPSNPQNDNRGSLLRSSKSKSSALSFCGESLNYQNYLSLWQKYLVLVCAIAPPSLPSNSVALRSLSPISLPTLDSVDAQTVTSLNSLIGRTVSSSNHSHDMRMMRATANNVTASSLFKLVVPVLRCELKDMWDILVLGLGSLNPASFDCLIDELQSLLRDTADKKGENIRRRRRRDVLRLQLIRLFEVIAFRGTLPLTTAVEVNTGQLRSIMLEFIDNARVFLENDVDRDPAIFGSMRIHFAKMITLFVYAFSPDRRLNLMPEIRKRQLFHLFSPWCNRVGHALDRKHSREHEMLNGLEQFSVLATCAILSCGGIFDAAKTLGDEGYLYGWLDALLTSHHEKVASLSEETLALMLDYNADTNQLVDWVLDRCYTSSARVADKCFRALATVVSQRDYPVDSTAMLVCTLMFCGHPDAKMQHLAKQLLLILEHRYFGESHHESLLLGQTGSSPQHNNNTTESSTTLAASPAADGDSADASGSAPTAAAANTSAASNNNPPGVNNSALNMKSNQYALSHYLAQAHPELTMSVFSEVTLRTDSGKAARRASLMRMLLPWLYNVELVDPNLVTSPHVSRSISLSFGAKMAEQQAASRRVLKGEGWGSAPATEMLLNNIMYMTVKLVCEQPVLIERMWCGLADGWPNNLRVILQYLSVCITMAPDTLLPFAKQIVTYIARTSSERLVEELINELQVIDTYRCLLERTEMPPYYRWLKNGDEAAANVTVEKAVEERQGIIHTRRHTPSESAAGTVSGHVKSASAGHADMIRNLQAQDPGLIEMGSGDDELPAMHASASMDSLITLKPDMVNNHAYNKHALPVPTIEERTERQNSQDSRRREWLQPFQLPMPPYGGWHAPLDVYLPDINPHCVTTLTPIYRSNLALLLMSDLVVTDVDIEWSVHLPLLLQIATLGLDSPLALIHDQCKQLLIHLVVAHSQHAVNLKDMACVLLNNNMSAMPQLCLATSNRNSAHECDAKFGTIDSEASTAIVCDSVTSSMMDVSNSRCGTPATLYTNNNDSALLGTFSHQHQQQLQRQRCQQRILFSGRPFDSVVDLALTMIECLSSKLGAPMWPCEDVTIKNWQIASGQQLSCFVGHLSRLFRLLLPAAKIESRWAQTSLQIALCSSNRHYAGRSFQIFRALRMPPTCRMISDVLSRLVETVCEHDSDSDMLQGYVTEILLTLDSAVVFMEAHEHSEQWEQQSETGSEAEEAAAANNSSGSPPANQMKTRLQQQGASPTHARSTSYSSGGIRHRTSPNADRRDVRNSACLMGAHVEEAMQQQQVLPRSKSAQVLRSINEGHDDHLSAMTQLMWIATSLLESDMEHEFLFALKIMDKLICLPETERTCCFDRLDRMIKQLGWNKFPGLLSLVLKGAVYQSTYETTVSVLCKLINLLDHVVVDPTCGQRGVPLIVVTALPLMLSAYERPTAVCSQMADAVIQLCHYTMQQQQFAAEAESAEAGTTGTMTSVGSTGSAEHPLEHLATMMNLYSRRAFSRDCVQWVRCVLKYLHDSSWVTSNPQLLVILTEMLERSGTQWQLPVLQIMYCLFQHVDLQTANAQTLNGDVIKAVAKHIQGPHWREAARIMKLTVTKGSILIAPSVNESGVLIGGSLPGRTMEFHLDMSHIIKELCQTPGLGGGSVSSRPSQNELQQGGSPRKTLNSQDAVDRAQYTQQGSFKRYTQCQLRVREHLVNLLNASGMRVGLPKSPSGSTKDQVIFSQISHDVQLEAANSVYSSSGELTSTGGGEQRGGTPSPEAHTDYTSDSFPRVFKEFDFLEAEHDSVSESAESCFNWMSSTLRPRSISQTDSFNQGPMSPGSGGGDTPIVAADQANQDDNRRSTASTATNVTETEKDETTNSSSTAASPVHNIRNSFSESEGRAASALNEARSVAEPSEHAILEEDAHSDEHSSDQSDREAEADRDMDAMTEEHETESIATSTVEEDSADTEGRDLQRLFVSTPTHSVTGGSTSHLSHEMLMAHQRSYTPQSLTASHLSLAASVSTPSVSDQPLPLYPPFALECTHHASGQIDDTWQMSVHDLHADVNGAATANATLVYTQLFRDCCAKVSSLLRDCCHYMLMSDTFKLPAQQFLSSLDVLMRVSDCPFLFVTAQLLQTTNLLQIQRYALFELREHYETFLERREHCIRLLNCVKSSVKLQMMGQRLDGCLFDQKVDLCRALHKLYFQILMMSECFIKMTEDLTSRLTADQGHNLCAEVLSLQRDLLCAVQDGTGAGRLDDTAFTNPVGTLLRLLHQRNAKAAIHVLRCLRTQHGKSDLYGCCEEEDIEVLLLYHCRAAAEMHPSSFAVIGSEHVFSASCQQLKQANQQLSVVVRQLQPGGSRVGGIRGSFVSSSQPSQASSSMS